jgi:hypothetical protein
MTTHVPLDYEIIARRAAEDLARLPGMLIDIIERVAMAVGVLEDMIQEAEKKLVLPTLVLHQPVDRPDDQSWLETEG